LGATRPIHHFSIPDNVRFDLDATSTAASITHNMVVQRVKQVDRALMEGIVETAKINGITDVYLLDEDFIVNALKRQIPMEPISTPWQWDVSHYCPTCRNPLNAPGLEQFQNGSYCDRCGQKIKWGDCHD